MCFTTNHDFVGEIFALKVCIGRCSAMLGYSAETETASGRDITVHVELKLGHGSAKGLQASPGMLGDVSIATSSKRQSLDRGKCLHARIKMAPVSNWMQFLRNSVETSEWATVAV
jgi:hypothetical protein